MSSKLHAIREAMLTAMAAATAGATYTYTWSAVDSVRVGMIPDALSPLPMFRLLPQVRMSTGYGRTQRDQHSTATMSFIAIVPAILSTSDAAMDSAEAALEDIEVVLRVFMEAHGGGCEVARVSQSTLWGALAEGIGEAGVVEGEIEIEFTVHRGA